MDINLVLSKLIAKYQTERWFKGVRVGRKDGIDYFEMFSSRKLMSYETPKEFMGFQISIIVEQHVTIS